MNEKEIAREYVDFYYQMFKKTDTCFGLCDEETSKGNCEGTGHGCFLCFKLAKECAIKCVDEIIRLGNRPDLFKMKTKRQHINNVVVDESYVEYWDEVKEEIKSYERYRY
jgi:hypothetical protein